MFLWKRKKKIEDIAKPIPLEVAKKLVKILVVDDVPEHFPTDHMKSSGYDNLVFKESIDASLLARLEKGDFDILILDIDGVAEKEISEDGGLSIIKRLKKVIPSLIIIAFSGKTYALDKTEFWKLADDTLTKPATLVKCTNVVDGLIAKKFTLQYYWNQTKNILENCGINEKAIMKIENQIASKEIRSNTDLENLLKKLNLASDSIIKLNLLITKIFSIFLA